jgi:hypothetical protein
LLPIGSRRGRHCPCFVLGIKRLGLRVSHQFEKLHTLAHIGLAPRVPSC